jgi:hypothetical protein
VLLSLPISILLFTYAVTMVSLGRGPADHLPRRSGPGGRLAGCRGFGALERARARRLLGLDVADPSRCG